MEVGPEGQVFLAQSRLLALSRQIQAELLSL
jgi:hypothetical protein